MPLLPFSHARFGNASRLTTLCWPIVLLSSGQTRADSAAPSQRHKAGGVFYPPETSNHKTLHPISHLLISASIPSSLSHFLSFHQLPPLLSRLSHPPSLIHSATTLSVRLSVSAGLSGSFLISLLPMRLSLSWKGDWGRPFSHWLTTGNSWRRGWCQ